MTHPRHPISQKSDPKHQKLSHLYLFLLCLISLFILNFLQQIRLLKLYILHYSKATRFVTLIIQKWIKIRLSGSRFIKAQSSIWMSHTETHTHTHTHIHTQSKNIFQSRGQIWIKYVRNMNYGSNCQWIERLEENNKKSYLYN